MSQFKVKTSNLVVGAYLGQNPKLVDYLTERQVKVITIPYSVIQKLTKNENYDELVEVEGEEMKFTTIQVDNDGNCRMVLLQPKKRGTFLSSYIYLVDEDLADILKKI